MSQRKQVNHPDRLSVEEHVRELVPRRVYSAEFKQEAVRLARERGNIEQTARDLSVNPTVLHRWIKRLEGVPEHEVAFPGNGKAKDPELARLQRENARLKEEVEILKKAVGIFSIRPL